LYISGKHSKSISINVVKSNEISQYSSQRKACQKIKDQTKTTKKSHILVNTPGLIEDSISDNNRPGTKQADKNGANVNWTGKPDSAQYAQISFLDQSQEKTEQLFME